MTDGSATDGGGISNSGTLTLMNCSLSGNSALSGGGIYNYAGTLTITGSTISANSASADGGGIFNDSGAVTVVSSTFGGNSASENNGGGVYNNSGTIILSSSTLSGNFGDGIFNGSGTVTVSSSVVAGNTTGTDPEISGSYAASDSLIGGNPLLAPLGNYGGPTQTMAPLSDSPALSAGDPNAVDPNGNPITTDQRGFARPHGTGATPDIGAFQTQGSAVTHFTVSAPTTSTAGTSVSFTVTARDDFNDAITSYSGTVHFSSSDGQAGLPGNATLTNGVGTFTATLITAGNQTITATDTSNGNIAGVSTGTIISPAAASQFIVAAPGSTTAGSAFSITVTAQDAYGNTATGYTGTVHFSSSDGQASLPGNTTLNNGVGTFTATLFTAGNQTITAMDTSNGNIRGSATITTSPAGASQFMVNAPGNATVGYPISLTVTAQDPYGNTVSSYAGTVHFTSTDSAASLPADATLTNGVGTFNATLRTAGNQTITATDTTNSSITGTSAVIAVCPTTDSWSNSLGGSWNTPGNWSAGIVPGPHTDVQISLSGNVTVDLTGLNVTINSLQLSDALVLHSASLTTSGAIQVSGQLTVYSGTLAAGGGLSAALARLISKAGLIAARQFWLIRVSS